MSRTTLIRITTSLVALPVLIFFLLSGGWALKGALFVLSVLGMNEFYRTVSEKHKPIHFIGYSQAVFYYALLDFAHPFMVVTAVLIPFMLAINVLSVKHHKTQTIQDASTTFFGFFYVTVFLSCLYLILEHSGGWMVSVVFISAWGCDTGAYVFGKLFGKRKLAPNLSPNKTMEGAVGGTLTAGVLTAVIAFFAYEPDVLRILIFAAVGITNAVFAQLGDLFASSIKRHFGIKDFGRVLPGHGGVIDRFDSVLFTAPVVFLLITLNVV